MLWIYKCPCGKSIERLSRRAGTCTILLSRASTRWTGVTGGSEGSTLSCIWGVCIMWTIVDIHAGFNFTQRKHIRNRDFQDEKWGSNLAHIWAIRSLTTRILTDQTTTTLINYRARLVWILLVSPIFPPIQKHVGQIPTLEGLWHLEGTGLWWVPYLLRNSNRDELGNVQ